MVWYVKSETNPTIFYTVEKFGERWVCSCKSFKYNCHTEEGLKNNKRRFCKHILKIKEMK